MIVAIKRFFDSQLASPEQETNEHKVSRLRLASAALMFELLKTDRHIDERETDMMRRVLEKTFDLDQRQLDEIIALAEDEAAQAVSLYEFTSLVNEAYQYEDKVQLVENLWRLALADDHLDKYEEQMIRKTADLLYVSHSDFIRTKLRVRDGGR
ncbi:TerB family tellurite resistance protein [Pseudohongiella sp.]|uniref:Co-chaperone DjlA N-terminal domain-containing protein n=1 Tax=marine sediment metagenome TaxID=412755 RepID=A0A0F9Z076_9ZZZZ|nr:TerB family tellurite resistance protein [Pseudohongiella sp.]HDZ09722.1 TerB family tellurite resistance protein [Pseudohongiella sp.]HEA61664.1 TerB family tellurite resistance protein [Pseudohongiella sp.]